MHIFSEDKMLWTIKTNIGKTTNVGICSPFETSLKQQTFLPHWKKTPNRVLCLAVGYEQAIICLPKKYEVFFFFFSNTKSIVFIEYITDHWYP